MCVRFVYQFRMESFNALNARYAGAGNAHLNSEGGNISKADLLLLNGKKSTASPKHFFRFQSILALTPSKLG